MNEQSPIGVFDSGVGGLTILKKLVEDFPHEDFIYFGDSKHFPYGTKKSEYVRNRVFTIAKYFENLKVKAIIIACNSASSNKECLENNIDVEVIDVISGAAKEAVKQTKNQRIILLATELTVRNGHYERLIRPHARLFSYPSTALVDLVENNDLSNKEEVFKTVDCHLANLKKVNADTVILGCTHFGAIKDEIAKSLDNPTLITSDEPVSKQLKEYLKKNSLFNKNSEVGTITVLSNGDIEKMKNKVTFFGLNYEGVFPIDI